MRRTVFLISLSVGVFFLGGTTALGIDVVRTSFSTKSHQEILPKVLGAYTDASNGETQSEKDVTVGWVGDIVPSETIPTFSPEVKNWLASPDLMIGNLEGTLGVYPKTKCRTSPESCYTFVGTADFMQSLKDDGFDGVNIANNHSYDGGAVGFLDIKNILSATGILAVGEKEKTTITEVSGTQIALLGFGTNYWTNSLSDTAKVKQIISVASLQYPIVIVTFHAGSEGEEANHVNSQTEYYKGEDRGNSYAFAHTAIDAGADLVLGSGPHVVRAVEKYNDRLIVYSAGNFLTADGMSNSGSLGVGALFNITISSNGELKNLVIHSVNSGKNNTVSEDQNGTALSSIESLTNEDIGQILSSDIIAKKVHDTGLTLRESLGN